EFYWPCCCSEGFFIPIKKPMKSRSNLQKPTPDEKSAHYHLLLAAGGRIGGSAMVVFCQTPTGIRYRPHCLRTQEPRLPRFGQIFTKSGPGRHHNPQTPYSRAKPIDW